MIRLFYQLAIGLFLLACAQLATAQAIRMESSSANSLVKQEAWRFRAGDSTGWSSPAYNHAGWSVINPDVALSSNEALWKAGRGWFRKTIRFRRLTHDPITMTIQQFGTSEVYLDGRRVGLLRPAQFDSGGSQRMIAFVPIPINDTSKHTLAVRYAFRRDPLNGLSVSKEAFQLDFQLTDRAAIDLQDSQIASARIEYLLVGIFGVLSLLHILFYRANPSQRVNLILSLTMLAFGLIFLFEQITTEAGTLTLDSFMLTVSWIVSCLALGLLLLSLYIYLGRSPGPIFWILMTILGILVIYNSFIRQIPESSGSVPFVLVLFDYIRVSWLAKRRNPSPEARLPWNSLKFSLYSLLGVIVVSLVGAMVSRAFMGSSNLDLLLIPLVLLGLAGLFSIPIGLSFSLVGDYARTYQSLRQQLEVVKNLSAQTLMQEQEKQALLARQNEVLEHQVADRTAELKQSLTELRETQTQLVQREKLASLGELTAGIAHEIQNPLNFVKNFSEVSTELVAELVEETGKPDRNSSLEAELLADLNQNLQKISHHGNRASSIVKGMLEHSRSIAGKKQPTDLNALTEENLTLAYHAFRVKIPAFEAKLIMQFDPELGLIPVVEQEIGRVLLNLFGNAFYALHKRNMNAETGYEPTLRVSTRQTGKGVVLQIWDNGTGIPEQARPKLFQPFFTTKPTGEGTGLGLSLSYDIITKGYGGSLSINTEEGWFTEFTITLPQPTTP